MGRKNPRSNESEEFDAAAAALETPADGEAIAALREQVTRTVSMAAAPPIDTPVATLASIEPVNRETPVVLFYDGPIPSANFPVRRGEEVLYVHAEKGQYTEPLAPAIAEILVQSGKGFTVAGRLVESSEEQASSNE